MKCARRSPSFVGINEPTPPPPPSSTRSSIVLELERDFYFFLLFKKKTRFKAMLLKESFLFLFCWLENRRETGRDDGLNQVGNGLKIEFEIGLNWGSCGGFDRFKWVWTGETGLKSMVLGYDRFHGRSDWVKMYAYGL